MAEPHQWPDVRRVTLVDLAEIIGLGVKDFARAPGYSLAFGFLYAAAGWLLIALLVKFNLPHLAYPLAMGFALIAPFAAAGFYAVSDLLERGEVLSWSRVLKALGVASRRDLRWMALVTGFALVLWMDIAALLTFAFGGIDILSGDFLDTLLTTPSGLTFLAVGNLAGAIIAFGVFSISAVSFPMLYDRDIDFVTAMVTSVRLVLNNPVPMIAWCAVIGVLMGLSILSAFFGLLVFLPVVGHATWHLYRRAVAPAPTPAPMAERLLSP